MLRPAIRLLSAGMPRALALAGRVLGRVPRTAGAGLAGASIAVAVAGWRFVPFAAALVIVAAACVAARRERRALRFLYGVAQSLSRAADVETAMADLLERTRDGLRARTAEIVLFGADGEAPLRMSLGTERELRPVPEALAAALRSSLRVDRAVIVTRAQAPAALAAHLSEQDIAAAVLAPVPGQARIAGAMLLGVRRGRVSASRLRLLRALAADAGGCLALDRAATRRLRELQGALARQACRDPLTDLANRACFMRCLHDSLARSSGTCTVLVLDLDDFRRVNDRCGHAAGDAVLEACAQRMRRCVRPSDLAARLGGDEFAILLEDAGEQGPEVAGRVAAELSHAIVVDGRSTQVCASVGLASAGPGSDADGLLRHAGIALARAKQAGRGQVRTFAPHMRPGEPSRDELLAALEAGQFVAHFQPIVDIRSGAMVAAEALVRWSHPRHGLLPPSAFVAAAEATGTIPAIDRVVLEQACREAVSWSEEDGYAPDAAVHVNLSGEGLRTAEVADVVRDVLARTGLAPRRLVLELTESVLIAELPMAQAVLAELRELGVRIALDDFGTGYSSLACLRSLPLDILKVAKPFVDGAGRTPHDHALLAMIIELGSLFGVRVVAEGIERREQLDALTQLRCDMAQGFYLGRPLDGEARRFARRDPLAAAA